jgi:4-hydroxy-2-oxoheptanedioate aldolase
MATHRLLQAFRASKPAFGAWLTIPGTWAARTAATASPHISWLVLDCEHGLIPLQPGTAEIVAAVTTMGSNVPSVLVRIPATGPCADGSAAWQIKYVLDAGARGIIVPMVRLPQHVPHGVRSTSRFCRSPLQHRLGQSSPRPDSLPKEHEDSAIHSHTCHGVFRPWII